MRQFGELAVQAALENIPRILDCVGETARAAGFDERAVRQIQVAVDEACANIIEHAYGCTHEGSMSIQCCFDSDRLVVKIKDWGRSFCPDLVPEPNVDAPLDERDLGGLGLFLIRKLMDEVYFSFSSEQGNELVMVKYLSPVERGQGAPQARGR